MYSAQFTVYSALCTGEAAERPLSVPPPWCRAPLQDVVFVLRTSVSLLFLIRQNTFYGVLLPWSRSVGSAMIIRHPFGWLLFFVVVGNQGVTRGKNNLTQIWQGVKNYTLSNHAANLKPAHAQEAISRRWRKILHIRRLTEENTHLV